jgi:hypothetical protein
LSSSVSGVGGGVCRRNDGAVTIAIAFTRSGDCVRCLKEEDKKKIG